jgi:hypothetical protein
MATSGFADAVLGAGSRIGRHFGVVSTIPSASLVLFVYALAHSGAWTGPPDWGAAAGALGHLGIAEVSLLLFVTLGVGLVVHPLQFGMIQMLEGYWGASLLGRRAAAARIAHYRGVAERYDENRKNAAWVLEKRGHLLDGATRTRLIVEKEALERASQRYPEEQDQIMATQLGNVMRRFEALAGTQYGLDLLTIAPHLGLISPAPQLAYVDDSRTQLDLAVRFCVVFLLAFLVSVVFLLPAGPWLLIAGVPLALAYTSYRGAIVAAIDYGGALATLIDLNRFRLYDELRVPTPRHTVAERRRNPALMYLLRFERWPSLAYTRDDGPRRHAAGRQRLRPPSERIIGRFMTRIRSRTQG